MSVTSSGLSSISKTINSTSGLFSDILFAIFFNNVVFINSSNLFLFAAFSGCSSFTSPTNINEGNFSPSFVLAIPFIISPVSSLNLLI